MTRTKVIVSAVIFVAAFLMLIFAGSRFVKALSVQKVSDEFVASIEADKDSGSKIQSESSTDTLALDLSGGVKNDAGAFLVETSSENPIILTSAKTTKSANLSKSSNKKKNSGTKNKTKKKKNNKKKASKTKKEQKLKCIGTFKVTAYCKCSRCCGSSSGVTASGTRAAAGRTIAADTSRFPYGTKLVIDGHTYTVEDKGGSISGNRIDIYCSSHSSALQWGVKYCKVYMEE